MRRLVRDSRYVLTAHGQEEMEADGLTNFDVEHCILNGEIVERQRDQRRAEWKYLVEGETLAGRRAVIVARIARTGTLVIITVYARRESEGEQ
jgi:hypothetical protein